MKSGLIISLMAALKQMQTKPNRPDQMVIFPLSVLASGGAGNNGAGDHLIRSNTGQLILFSFAPLVHHVRQIGSLTGENMKQFSAACMLGMAMAHGVHAEPVVPDPMAARVAACVACHGKEGRATNDGYFPRIAGKPAGYLYNQLINFREGRRQYPLMTYMVSPLSDAYLKQMAEHFAAQHPPYPPPQPASLPAAALARAQALVLQGDRARNIPACVACHGERLTGVQPALPSLVGLPRDYLNAQFGAWKTGARKAAAPDCMAQIARQLSADEIGAVSAWLAAQPIPADMAAAPAGTVKLPIPCGSMTQ